MTMKTSVIHDALKFQARRTIRTDTMVLQTFTVDDAVKVHRTYTALLFVSFHFPTGRIRGLPLFCSVRYGRYIIGKNCSPILGGCDLKV